MRNWPTEPAAPVMSILFMVSFYPGDQRPGKVDWDSMADISIILPCMNEEDGIEILRSKLFPTVEELRKSRTVEVLLVDDGSTDGTLTGLKALAASFPGIRVLNHERNRGLGAAIRTGVKEAKGAILVTTDFD